MEVTKELIVFLAVLVAISVTLALGKITSDQFLNVLFLIIGGVTGWGIRTSVEIYKEKD